MRSVTVTGGYERAATSRCTKQSRLADRVTHPPVGMHEAGRDRRIPARAPRGRVARGGEAVKASAIAFPTEANNHCL
jgi:hypothetical protein